MLQKVGLMPYEYKGNRDEIEPSNSLPYNLQHRSVYALPYEHFDGPFASDTDARFISVGLAQWNQGEVSVKVLRFANNGGKWTRQSEELPLHRVVDAALFLAKALFTADTVDGSVTLPTGMFEGQESELVITREDVGGLARNFDRFLRDEEIGSRLKARYRALYDALDDLVKDGKL